MTIEDLLEEISGRGWYVYLARHNNDYRPVHTQWEVTLRLSNGINSKVSFATGETFHIALSNAIDRIPKAVDHKLPEYKIYNGKPLNEDKPANLSSIINKMLKKEKLIRRL